MARLEEQTVLAAYSLTSLFANEQMRRFVGGVKIGRKIAENYQIMQQCSGHIDREGSSKMW